MSSNQLNNNSGNVNNCINTVNVIGQLWQKKKVDIIWKACCLITLFVIILIAERMLVLNTNIFTGKFLVFSFSFVTIILSIIYVVFYNSGINYIDLVKKFKYLFLSISFGIFIIYYYSNSNIILQSISYNPSWVRKSTFVFFVYFGLFISIQFLIFIIVGKNISSVKIGPKGLELGFEQSLVKKLENITINISDVLKNSIILIDSISDVIKNDFMNITLSDAISIDTYFEFIKNTTNKIFNNMGMTVNLKIDYFGNDAIIDRIFKDADSSIITKINSIRDLQNENIVRFEKYLLIPIAFESINKKVLYIVEFADSAQCIADFGSIVYTTLKYIDCSVLKYLQEKTLEELDEVI